MVERTIPGNPRPALPEVGQNPRGAMRGALMCRFLSHQGTEYTLSGLFSVNSVGSSDRRERVCDKVLFLVVAGGWAVTSADSKERRDWA